MKNILLFTSISFTIIFFSNNTFAQIEISENFSGKLEKMGMTFSEPLENSYKKVAVQKNIILDYDFGIKAKKADMEIRFALFPEKTNSNYPHINMMSMASSIGTNQEEPQMVLHQLPKKELEKYNADWGAMIFFQPKGIFTHKKHCKMLALYTEGKGLIYIFYLFDKATEEVDFQKYIVEFEG